MRKEIESIILSLLDSPHVKKKEEKESSKAYRPERKNYLPRDDPATTTISYRHCSFDQCLTPTGRHKMAVKIVLIAIDWFVGLKYNLS